MLFLLKLLLKLDGKAEDEEEEICVGVGEG